MLLTSGLLAVLAIALAWPVPIVLAGARWTSRAPGTALVLWQAIALSGGLAMIGSLLCFGLAPFGSSIPSGLSGFLRSVGDGSLPAGAIFAQLFALSGAILLGLHLILTLALTVVRAERGRRRHRRLIELLSAPIPQRPGIRLLDLEAPVAYCLPGTTASLTVLSAGLVELLDDDQLAAVVAHENAHLAQRHDLVLLAFRAWRSSLPWFPIATRALDAVAILVELLADDQALQSVDGRTLARSITLVAAQSPVQSVAPALPSGGLVLSRPSHEDPIGSRSPVATLRIARITDAALPLRAPARTLAVVTAAALVVVPTVLLLAPAFAG